MTTDITIGRFGFGRAIVLGVVEPLVALSGQAAERVMPGTRVASVGVSYADLDLSSAAGAQTLHARLADAVSRVGSARLHAPHAERTAQSTMS